MEMIQQLEEKFQIMVNKIRALEEENTRLNRELEAVRSNRDDVLARIDSLLVRVEGELEK